MASITINTDNLRVFSIDKEDFKLIWHDKHKKTKNGHEEYINANYFAPYDELDEETGKNYSFTLPVAHLMCDIDYNSLTSIEKKYMLERGKFNADNTKWIFNSYNWSYQNPFYRKRVSTFIMRADGSFGIEDILGLDTYVKGGIQYAISGLPVLRNGEDVSWINYCIPQGWGTDVVRATTHNFIGIAKNVPDKIYLIQFTSKKANIVYSAEFYNAIKNYTFSDIIKLDGGGSYICRSKSLGIDKYTDGNRIINCIITFDHPVEISTSEARDVAWYEEKLKEAQEAEEQWKKEAQEADNAYFMLKQQFDNYKSKVNRTLEELQETIREFQNT